MPTYAPTISVFGRHFVDPKEDSVPILALSRNDDSESIIIGNGGQIRSNSQELEEHEVWRSISPDALDNVGPFGGEILIDMLKTFAHDLNELKFYRSTLYQSAGGMYRDTPIYSVPTSLNVTELNKQLNIRIAEVASKTDWQGVYIVMSPKLYEMLCVDGYSEFAPSQLGRRNVSSSLKTIKGLDASVVVDPCIPVRFQEPGRNEFIYITHDQLWNFWQVESERFTLTLARRQVGQSVDISLKSRFAFAPHKSRDASLIVKIENQD